MTRQEALIEAHRIAAVAIRRRIQDGSLARDWNDSEAIRHALEDMEIRHWKTIERLRARAARENA